jgi:HEAT repeat protein
MFLADKQLNLGRNGSSLLVLGSFVALVLVVGVLYWTGIVGWIIGLVRVVIQTTVRTGFWLWRQLFSWAPWPVMLGLVLGLLVTGWALGQNHPLAAVGCGGALLFVGGTNCLAYIFIDVERYEVARGYKALHKPLAGQELARNLVQYGRRVGVPLLIVATLGALGGFALTNEGLYETIGSGWYTLGQHRAGQESAAPDYWDFLAYTLINLFRVADLLNLADSYNYVHVTYVHQARWPASTLLAGFRTFFTLVLLEQIFASVRRWRLLAETITDFWSPHPPIHERARSALPQHGPGAVQPLLASLRAIPVLTAEQRAYIPRIIADIGPATIPILVEHLADPHEHVRAIAVAALGDLRARDAVLAMSRLAEDPSDAVRLALVEALGLFGGTAARAIKQRRALERALHSRRRWPWLRFHRPRPAPSGRRHNPLALAITTLRGALADRAAAVRTQAARSLGQIGPAAASVTPDLVKLLHVPDEAVRCQAAEALGQIGGAATETLPALVELLADPSPLIQTSAATALGAMKKEAADAVPALVPLVQSHDETVRAAAAQAISQIGNLEGDTLATLLGGLSSHDNLVRAQTAEVLGEIGAPAAEAAPALAEALSDSNDRVRAKAAAALGAMGESASDAVPHLVRALSDKDNWVSALAAEALGEIGEPAAGAIPALVRSLRHLNPAVRSNAARALGKMGAAAQSAVPALERAAQDADDEVRLQAIAALGDIGSLTETAGRLVLAALQDSNPKVRAAAVEALGKRTELQQDAGGVLVGALGDPNDQVKLAAIKALSAVAGEVAGAIAGLSAMLQDDNVEVQAQAALALGRRGADAVAAGPALLQAAQTSEAEVREQALRALALIQPPEAMAAFLAGLKDAQPEIRKVASAGLVKLAEIPDEQLPYLIEVLHDPEIQVRANAAHLLAQQEILPASAIPALIECTAELDDGLRLHAALALRSAPAHQATPAFEHLLADTNPRLRLIAAGVLLEADATHAQAGAILEAALADPLPRMRRAAIDLIEALDARGTAFLELLRRQAQGEVEPELADRLDQLIERLEQIPIPEPRPERSLADLLPLSLPFSRQPAVPEAPVTVPPP